ncbi:hypothetical protein JTB14_031088 [Gonioctena quinquepunctata]|nr:hypothetical protein JTB14_031088 [Gonioctena quinquepunctata]
MAHLVVSEMQIHQGGCPKMSFIYFWSILSSTHPNDHESHLSLEVISFCKKIGVEVISPTPHCSYKMQALAWSKTTTIYDKPNIVRQALPLAATPTNIPAGFRVTEFFLPNRHIFGDDEFLPTAVTYRPNPENAENMTNPDIYEQSTSRNSPIIMNSPPN